MKRFTKAEYVLPFIIILFSTTGLFVSFLLTTEKIELLKNANRVLPCTVNIIINCASVMKSPQAEIFGFPNSLLGIIGYSVMLTFGMALLFTKTKSKVFILLATLGSFLSVIFSYWLLFQSVYVIEALCPYCLISCFSATNIFLTLIYWNIQTGNFKPLLKLNWEKHGGTFQSIFGSLIILWYLILVILIYLHFGDNLLS